MKTYYINRENIRMVLSNIKEKRTYMKDREEMVLKVIEDVKRRGDDALIEYTKIFDGIILSKDKIPVKSEEIKNAYSYISEEQIKALKILKENIEKVEKETFNRMFFKIENDGFQIIQTLKPINSVGCYVPGGEASYPSTVLMAAIPAKVAGVKRVIVVSPPKNLSAPLLVAADIAGVTEIYRIGGAHAIAALAYGTETVKPVDKIVGPGGKYVTLAKAAVACDVAIDMLAGPSELVIYAEGESYAEQIVLDLIAQAEHSSDTICGLVTTSSNLIKRVAQLLPEYIMSAHRRNIVNLSIENNGFLALAENEEVAVDFINELAPEHLEIFSKDYEKILDSIKNVGAIMINGSSVVTDYYCGINHILPTSGQARYRGGLSCLDFVKIVKVIVASEKYSEKTHFVIEQLGKCEGLLNHVNSLMYRKEIR
ncbi:MAG: histidinol dehydrogenase [Nitrososphaeria archaeon]|nr:histidinol dehydrogenase [Nitrososphaeria archaeon]